MHLTTLKVACLPNTKLLSFPPVQKTTNADLANVDFSPCCIAENGLSSATPWWRAALRIAWNDVLLNCPRFETNEEDYDWNSVFWHPAAANSLHDRSIPCWKRCIYWPVETRYRWKVHEINIKLTANELRVFFLLCFVLFLCSRFGWFFLHSLLICAFYVFLRTVFWLGDRKETWKEGNVMRSTLLYL